MQPYSLDLRTRVAAACQLPDARQAAVAERFGVSLSFVKKLLRQLQQTGSLVPRPARGGRARYLDAAAQAWLVAYVGQHPDATLAELGQAWQAQGGRPVGQTCLWQVLDAHQLRRKKKVGTPVSATRPGWWRSGRRLSKPSPSTTTRVGFIFWTKRVCAWTSAAATAGR